MTGETDGDFFHRLETNNNIDSYIIIVPSDTKVLGTVFEGGMLERDFHYGKNPTILLFLQSSYARLDNHGNVKFQEKGKRTHYLESLATRAHHTDFWHDEKDLVQQVLEWTSLD